MVRSSRGIRLVRFLCEKAANGPDHHRTKKKLPPGVLGRPHRQSAESPVKWRSEILGGCRFWTHVPRVGWVPLWGREHGHWRRHQVPRHPRPSLRSRVNRLASAPARGCHTYRRSSPCSSAATYSSSVPSSSRSAAIAACSKPEESRSMLSLDHSLRGFRPGRRSHSPLRNAAATSSFFPSPSRSPAVRKRGEAIRDGRDRDSSVR